MRTDPMEVLVLGLCRTGTQSIKQALEQLGYKGVYHMAEVIKNNHFDWWNSALQAKYENGETVSLENIEEVLSGYQAVSDMPSSLLADELIAAYPNAKIILSNRSEDSWINSMNSTICHLFDPSKADSKQDALIKSVGLLPTREELPGIFSHLSLINKYCWQNDFAKNGRQYFRDHNENVRNLAEQNGRPFLEYEVKQGWKPLCEFLGKPIPDTEFPRQDAWKPYQKFLADGVADAPVKFAEVAA